MLFKRKKDIDLRDLQRKGLIKIPKKDVKMEADKNGFINLAKNGLFQENLSGNNLLSSKPEQGPFNFMDSDLKNNSSGISQTVGLEEKRERTRKFEEMDNKIYRLEQRIELLERKVGVGSSSSYSW